MAQRRAAVRKLISSITGRNAGQPAAAHRGARIHSLEGRGDDLLFAQRMAWNPPWIAHCAITIFYFYPLESLAIEDISNGGPSAP
jgi:hypothetical protein